MIDKDVDFKSVSKGDEVAPLNTEEPEEQKSDLQLQEEKVLLAGGFKLPSKPTHKDTPYGKNKKETVATRKTGTQALKIPINTSQGGNINV